MLQKHAVLGGSVVRVLCLAGFSHREVVKIRVDIDAHQLLNLMKTSTESKKWC